VPYLSALEMCSRQGAIQIHAYLTLPFHCATKTAVRTDPVNNKIAEGLIGTVDLHDVVRDFATSTDQGPGRIITAAGQRREVGVAGKQVSRKHPTV